MNLRKSFNADHVYLCDIFGSAREKAGNLTINDLINKIAGAKHLDLNDNKSLESHGSAVYLFMGAGDVQKYMSAFKSYLEKEETV